MKNKYKELSSLCGMYIDSIKNKNVSNFIEVIRYNGIRMDIHTKIISELHDITGLDTFEIRRRTQQLTDNAPLNHRLFMRELLSLLK